MNSPKQNEVLFTPEEGYLVVVGRESRERRRLAWTGGGEGRMRGRYDLALDITVLAEVPQRQAIPCCCQLNLMNYASSV
ncbi:hypothetical protein WN944_021321 [Citrus x changshan-huyou]|uniref:Uncharacterized protein n=1 Tax=Citrus x changshan-huyou TaxID=2935761 RepID=A0AAP0MZ17_9ROSI